MNKLDIILRTPEPVKQNIMNKLSLLSLYSCIAVVILISCTQKKAAPFCSAFQKIIDKAVEKKLADFKGEEFQSKTYAGVSFRCKVELPETKESGLYAAFAKDTRMYNYLAVMNFTNDKKEAETVFNKTSKQIKECVAALGMNVNIFDQSDRNRPPDNPDDKEMGFLYKHLLIRLTNEFSEIYNQYICTLYITHNPDAE